jgi:hypothetical protein
MSAESIMFIAIGLYLILSILEDFGYIENNSRLWHWADAAGLILFVGYGVYTQYSATWKTVIISGDISVVWWFAFDIGLNLKRGLPMFYVGSGTIDLIVKWVAKKIGVGEDRLMFCIKLSAAIMMGIITWKYLK